MFATVGSKTSELIKNSVDEGMNYAVLCSGYADEITDRDDAVLRFALDEYKAADVALRSLLKERAVDPMVVGAGDDDYRARVANHPVEFSDDYSA